MGEKLPEKELQARVTALILCLCLIFVFLGARLAHLQIIEGEYFNVLADGNRVRIVPLRAPRGAIYDRHGEVIATSRPAYSVSMIVMNRKEAQESAEKLADLLGMQRQEVLAKIEKNADRLYEPIRITADISPEIHTLIEEMKAELPGVVIEVEPVREYVVGAAPHSVGYVGEITEAQLHDPRYLGYKIGEIIGQSGIELEYDRFLRGTDGGKQVEVDHRGRPTPRILGQIEPVSGHDIMLSLDLRLQQIVEREMRDHLELLQQGEYENAKAASMVVLDINSGYVLAMANLPAFDPNEFVKGLSTTQFMSMLQDPLRPFNNRAIAGLYAPGSTFKMVTAIAALEEARVTPDERIYCSGYHPLVPSLGCFRRQAHGGVDLVRSLVVSCNVYYYELGRRLGVDTIAEYATKLGLGAKTGIDIAGEASGLMPTTSWKREAYETKTPSWISEPQFLLAEHMMVGIGQVYNTYTPLQMANYVATIANSGSRYRPQLLKKVINPDGEVVLETSPEILDNIDLSPETLDLIKQGMLGVTEPGGTAGGVFAGFPIKVAGKTGTADNPHGDDHAWFVGYAPAENPSIAFAVIIEQGGFGGASAGALARKVLAEYFQVDIQQTTVR